TGAFEKFLRATEIDPEYASAHFNKALALQMMNRAADAADAFQRYLDLRPDAGNAGQVRAQIEELRAGATNN
ncbi:MAG: tetratricopeptide repeat protein, partial [Alphaproteobacteria bacterium]